MPVPKVPFVIGKLQTKRRRRGLFSSVLLMGLFPMGLAAQDVVTAPLSQNRLDSAVGDIPASPWSRRNNPARQSSSEFENPVSQPNAYRQNRPADPSQQEIRLGDPSPRSPESSRTTSSTSPATIRWGSIQAPGPNDTQPVAARDTTPGRNQPRSSQPSARPVKRDRMQEQNRFQEETSEYTEADPIVALEEEIESLENISGHTPETVSSQLASSPSKSSSRNSHAKAEPLVKPAATRSRSVTIDTELDLGFPVETSRESTPKQNGAKPNSPIRLVPVDSIPLNTSRDEVSPQIPSYQSSDSLPAAHDETGAKRMLVAQRLSHELLSQNQAPPARAPQALENPAGWQSIEQELRSNLERCDQLLRRGAVHSARSEVISGLRRLFRSMDAYRGSFTSEPAMDLALTAFREEADFHSPQGISSVASVVSTHSTTALKNRPLEGVSPEVASQHYRVFARYQWIIASDGHRWASDLLYALGKTYEKEAELIAVSAIRLRSQAVICYQSAIQITPTQSEASNQLGYALIHLDRIEEAYDALKSSLESQPNPQAWSNLAEVYRRRGAIDSANFAVQQASSLAQSAAPAFTAENPEVTQVDPAIFARYSPAQNVIAPTANSIGATPPTQVAKQPNFFSKMFAR